MTHYTMSDYVIAIPTYQRSHILKTCTLQFCVDMSIPLCKVHVFVAQADPEMNQYLLLKSIHPDINIHTDGPIGLHLMRNHITNFFEEGTFLLCMDDDIKRLVYMEEDPLVEDKKSCQRYKLIPHTTETFHSWVEAAFATLTLGDARLFGIYPVRNGYFMKDLPYLTTDLRFCVGAFWGCINDRSIVLQIEEKEDFERTLLQFEKYGSVHRYNHVAPVTNYYSTSGGMQARPKDRRDESHSSCEYLVERFPSLCKRHRTKSSGICEIKLLKTR
jgi:hypothetical protein